MHHDSEKSQAIHSSVTALGLLTYLRRRKDEQNAWVAISRTPTYNMIPIKLKAAVSVDGPCTACLDGLNRDILQHNEGIW